MPSPLAGRPLPKGKKAMPMRSMADVVASRQTSAAGSGGGGSSFNSSAFRAEALAAMGVGGSDKSVQASEDRLVFSSPEMALDSFKKGEFTKAESMTVVANLGLASEEDLDDLTPKQAIAMLESAVKETEADAEAARVAKENKAKNKTEKKAAVPKLMPKKPAMAVKEQSVEEEEKAPPTPAPAVIALRKKDKKALPSTTAAAVVVAKPVEKKVAAPVVADKKPNIVLKMKKSSTVSAQAASPSSTYTTPGGAATPPPSDKPADQKPLQPGAPVQPTQPATPGGPNLVPGQLVEVKDVNGNPVQYVVQPDLTMKPNMAGVQAKKADPDLVQKKTAVAETATEKKAETVMMMIAPASSKAGESRASAGVAASALPSSKPRMEKDSTLDDTPPPDVHYTARRVGNRWQVAAGANPVFSVDLNQSFPDEEKEYAGMFQDPAYGEELAAACNLRGAASVIQDIFQGNVKMEFRKSAYDYEAELVEALEAKPFVESAPDQIILAFAHEHPEAAKSMVAIYNDKSIPNDQLATRIRQAVSKRKGQYNQYGLGDMFDRTYAPDSAVKGGDEGQGMKQEEQAIMEPDINDQMAAKEKDKSNIVELFAEVMSPIISLSDAWDVEDVVRQMKDTFSDDEKIARFRGLLEEKIKQDKEHNSEIVREKSPEELDAAKKKSMPTQSPDQAQPQAEGGAGTIPTQAQAKLIEAALKRSIDEIRERVTAVGQELQGAKKEAQEANSRLVVAQQAITEKETLVENLVRERSARLRMPRVKELCEKLKKVGINRSVKDIMLYTDEIFAQREAEANALLARMAAVEERGMGGGEQLIGGSVPQIDSGEIEEEAFQNPFTSKAPQ